MRHIVSDRLDRLPVLPNPPNDPGRATMHGRRPRSSLVLGLVLLLCLAPSLTWAQTRDRQPASPGAGPVVPDADLWIYSSLLTVPYSAVKGVVAIYGGLLGGVLYLSSAGNLEMAKAIWGATIEGTYVLTPDHLRGQQPIHLVGAPAATPSTITSASSPPRNR